MLVRLNARRRVDDALAVASPLALAEAVEAHVAGLSTSEVHGLIARSLKRMDAVDRAQLALYLDVNDMGELAAHRFSAFLRQNPRAIGALDPQASNAILAHLGDLPKVEHLHRPLPLRTGGLVLLALVVALLPLGAQYLHQRGMLAGLRDPIAILPIALPVKTARASAPHRHPAKTRRVRPVRHVTRVAHKRVLKTPHRIAARRPAVRRRVTALAAPVRRAREVAWKFDPHNNPYFNRARWRHAALSVPATREPPFSSPVEGRARLAVRGYLRAVAAGNFAAAFAHLGMPANADPAALPERPIVEPGSRVAIVGSQTLDNGRTRVQADIRTHGREYYEIFNVVPDGPAQRIADRYYIPVNRSAQVAMHEAPHTRH